MQPLYNFIYSLSVAEISKLIGGLIAIVYLLPLIISIYLSNKKKRKISFFGLIVITFLVLFLLILGALIFSVLFPQITSNPISSSDRTWEDIDNFMTFLYNFLINYYTIVTIFYVSFIILIFSLSIFVKYHGGKLSGKIKSFFFAGVSRNDRIMDATYLFFFTIVLGICFLFLFAFLY